VDFSRITSASETGGLKLPISGIYLKLTNTNSAQKKEIARRTTSFQKIISE
jgi:hypothetical protein